MKDLAIYNYNKRKKNVGKLPSAKRVSLIILMAIPSSLSTAPSIIMIVIMSMTGSGVIILHKCVIRKNSAGSTGSAWKLKDGAWFASCQRIIDSGGRKHINF